MERRDYEQIKHDLRQAIGYMSRVIKAIDAEIENQQNQFNDDLDVVAVEPVAQPTTVEKAPKHHEIAQKVVDGVKPTKPGKHN